MTCYLNLKTFVAALLGALMATVGVPQDAVSQTSGEGWEVFQDCEHCPEMVVVWPGGFTMGPPPSEEGRDDDEGLRRRVTIGSPFAVGVHEVTRGEFGRFVSATGRSMANSCWTMENGEGKHRVGRDWRNPGFTQTDSHPAVCVSWEDAHDYARWLSRETGESYRLLSESEWEYAARAGRSTEEYWWPDWGGHGQCPANGADASSGLDWAGDEPDLGGAICDDGYFRTSPVGSFGANWYGLHDVDGNVWEWVQDCWNDSYAGAPGDGSAWERGYCSHRVARGGSWFDYPVLRYAGSDVAAAARDADIPDADIPSVLRRAGNDRAGPDIDSYGASSHGGFRVARTFTPAASEGDDVGVAPVKGPRRGALAMGWAKSGPHDNYVRGVWAFGFGDTKRDAVLKALTGCQLVADVHAVCEAHSDGYLDAEDPARRCVAVAVTVAGMEIPFPDEISVYSYGSVYNYGSTRDAAVKKTIAECEEYYAESCRVTDSPHGEVGVACLD